LISNIFLDGLLADAHSGEVISNTSPNEVMAAVKSAGWKNAAKGYRISERE